MTDCRWFGCHGYEGIRSFCWSNLIDANKAEKEITKCTKEGGEDGLHVVPWLHLVSKMLQVRLHLLRCLPMILKYYDFFASWYKEWCTHKYTNQQGNCQVWSYTTRYNPVLLQQYWLFVERRGGGIFRSQQSFLWTISDDGLSLSRGHQEMFQFGGVESVIASHAYYVYLYSTLNIEHWTLLWKSYT